MSLFILDISLRNSQQDTLVKHFSLNYSTTSKFKNDKVNYQDDDYYILLDGFVLNKKQLLEGNAQSTLSVYLIKSYQKNGNQFFNELKGSYYGFLFDKKKNKWIIFSDHISSKPVYFAKFQNHICFANNYIELVNHLKQNEQQVTLNEQAAYLLLSYGYVFEDITITNEIKRLMVGYSAVVQNGSLQFENFYTLTNNPIKISEADAIEEIDKRFKIAVKLAFEKDLEYGYKHLVALSGGLDSRMTAWVAHELGYTDQLNITFSQSNYLDETIAKQIASDLKHEWLFKALDNGNFLKDIDKTTKITGGNVLYYGLAHAMSMYKNINFDNLGILHSGQLGDVVVSTFYSSLNSNKNFKFGDGAYSSTLLSRIKNQSFKENYPNEEIFKMYIRGFYGANQGLQCASHFGETFSPFYDIDFMEFCLSIPVELRFAHQLYKKWIQIKYPEAAKYVWEKDKVPVNYPYWISIKGKKIPLNQLPHKVLVKLGVTKGGLDNPKHMNPLQYWYKTNDQLKIFMDNYYSQNIQLLNHYPLLKADCEKLYSSDKGTEKNQVLSFLSSLSYLLR